MWTSGFLVGEKPGPAAPFPVMQLTENTQVGLCRRLATIASLHFGTETFEFGDLFALDWGRSKVECAALNVVPKLTK